MTDRRSALGRTMIRSLAAGFLAASIAALGFSSFAGAQAQLEKLDPRLAQRLRDGS